ncbi:MAG: S-layer homology domain-containing protein, partial [Peptococcaceae bacterium]|nr:S-layer homology domain-containing protein [Peptococcaceae bacterium]
NGHVEVTETVPATCANDGFVKVSCSVCGEVISNTILEAIGHNEVTDTVAATCTDDGFIKVTCLTCGEVLIDETITAPGIDHAWGQWVIISLTDGTEMRACSNCIVTETRTIPAPTVTAVVPASGATNVATSGTITITFNEAMDTATTGTVQLNALAALTNGSWSEDGTVYTISYSGLYNSTVYAVNISGFKATSGYVMADNFANSFTTVASTSSSNENPSEQTGNPVVSESEPGDETQEEEITIEAEDTPLAGEPNPFADVQENAWYYDDVMYLFENDLMIGTGPDEFSPHMTMTRGAIAVVFYRQAGSPNVSGFANIFGDVAENEYYSAAVKWAAAKGLVLGYGDGRYGPDDIITREQLAIILYRSEKSSGFAPDMALPVKSFSDGDQISEYAKTAVNALTTQGIINGRPGDIFDPKGNATRAEFAAMFHRSFNTI